jgi:hypothetical protein
MVTWRWVYWIIPLVALAVIGMIIWGPGALFERTQQAVAGTVGFIQENVRIGTEELPAAEVHIPIQLKDAYNSLYAALQRAQQSSQVRCIVMYKEFPDIEGFIITFDYINGKMVMNLRTDDNIIITEFRKELPLKPCLVGGVTGTVSDPAAASNFFYNWISPRNYPKFSQFKVPEYNWFENGMRITDRETIVAAGHEYDLEDEELTYFGDAVSLLYKADDDAVCFIPTHDGDMTCDDEATEEGIDDDCMKELLPSGQFTVEVCR